MEPVASVLPSLTNRISHEEPVDSRAAVARSKKDPRSAASLSPQDRSEREGGMETRGASVYLPVEAARTPGICRTRLATP